MARYTIEPKMSLWAVLDSKGKEIQTFVSRWQAENKVKSLMSGPEPFRSEVKPLTFTPKPPPGKIEIFVPGKNEKCVMSDLEGNVCGAPTDGKEICSEHSNIWPRD